MRQLLTAVLPALVIGSVFAQTVPQSLYYKLNEGSGTLTLNEASPGVGTPTATLGAALSFGTGQLGGGLVGSGLSGFANYLDTGYAMNLNGQSWTIEFWWSPNGLGSTQYLCGSNFGSSAFRIFASPTAGNNVVCSGTGLTTSNMGGVVPAPNTWVHVAYVFDASTTPATLKGYANGVLSATATQTGTPTLNQGNLIVGASSTQQGLQGRLDEFRLWNVARTQAEILANMNVELFNENILTVVTSGGGVGDLFVSLTSLSQNAVEGFTFVTSSTPLPLATGPFFGIVPDGLTWPILTMPAAPGNPLHFLVGFPGLYPDQALMLPAGSLSVFSGQTWDFVTAVFGPGASYLGRSNVQRITW
ncbi:MAG TPA: LamG domain-containing protein [Planctomycetota bacterium]|nr:LamG domain-containing protein [Planctomycetota bacterium]